MAGFALFMLAAATPPAVETASAQHRVTAVASVSVVILQAERLDGKPSPNGVARQVNRRGDTILIEFN